MDIAREHINHLYENQSMNFTVDNYNNYFKTFKHFLIGNSKTQIDNMEIALWIYKSNLSIEDVKIEFNSEISNMVCQLRTNFAKIKTYSNQELFFKTNCYWF